MRHRPLPWSGLIALAAASGALVSTDASAQWPPPETATQADMSNPKYWPNDPSYAYTETGDGQWEDYSFIPKPDGSMQVRPSETQSGMSIDMAWRHSIGDDSIHLAITDSGFEWDTDDLAEKAWLNDKELTNHKPLHMDGTACGGTGDLAGFDCNGDGILSVSDYKDTPTLVPAATMGHPQGDKNNNGVLDAGDLILNFSDGIDDDKNGYIDDISGWDFMKDDNDPYDDTRYGHGTGEAHDSAATANNGIGSAGACPNCRFIPLRAGDSFIADVNDFAQAVVYATDNGAKVIQCALGTLDNNQYTQAALDYAYSKGVLAVTSMADENSRHHNMPAASNHTLPVHAIEYDGENVTSSTTFLQFHPCSNFGGQNFLSASASSCSSQATGLLAGMSGLLYSAAIKYNINPPLSPGEAQSIFFTTADDINVPESELPGSEYRWSQKGFDQRFGYGRINANKAIEALRDGRIPPSVDITSPTWFTVLYKDQVTAPVDIIGTVSASRANSYDITVEWGPGVQPLDTEFKTISTVSNIPPNVITGKDGTPLASVDIRSIDPTHTRDVDSLHGENDDTITIRVQSIAHYGGTIGDVPGEMRRTYYVHSDPDLVKGFPIQMGASGEGSPKMADIDGDGVRELIYPTSGGAVHVYKITQDGPKELWGTPFRTNLVDGLLNPPAPGRPSYLMAPGYSMGAANGGINTDLAREAITNTPAIADIDGDGKPEIVVSTWAGTIYVIESDGTPRKGWPKRLPEVPSCSLDPANPSKGVCMGEKALLARGAFASPVLADIDKDGHLDIIQAAFDGNVYVFDRDGVAVDGWPVNIHYTGTLSEEPNKNRILTTPAIGDFNGDGIPDMLVGSNERLGEGGQSGAIYLLDGRGTKTPGGKAALPNWPVTITSLEIFPLVAEGVPNSGVIGTFDGTLAAVMHGNASEPVILPLDPGKQGALNQDVPNEIPVHPDPTDPTQTAKGLYPSSIFGPLTVSGPNTFLPLFSQPSLGDLDQDGTPDVVASGGSLTLAQQLQGSSGGGAGKDSHFLAMWSGKTGAMMPASPLVLEDYTFFNSQAIADITGDNYPEVFTGSGGYFLHAVDACGREATGWPKFTGQWIIPTPAVGDLDGDHTLEVAVGTRDGWLYAWHTKGTDQSIIEWEGFHHDNLNSGNINTPLTQGGKQKAATPLTVDSCAAPTTAPPSNLEPAGGCGCTVAGDEGARDTGLFFGAIAVGLALSRRKKRTNRQGAKAPNLG